MEAFEHNGMDLPKEYLLAKLAFTKDPADEYRAYLQGHAQKDADRRNTGFHFDKADVWHSTAGSKGKQRRSLSCQITTAERISLTFLVCLIFVLLEAICSFKLRKMEVILTKAVLI